MTQAPNKEEVASNDNKEVADPNKKVDEVIDSETAKEYTETSKESTETSAMDPSKLRKYTVKSGDTIAGICMKLYGDYGNMKTIKELNQLVDENKIFEGQVLLIP